MFKRKLVTNSLIFAILICFVLQVAMFGASVSKTKTSGTVYASTGVPVSGAIVVASGPAGYGSATTNLLGIYTITEGLPAGTYTVMVMSAGYINSRTENVVVTVGSTKTGVDLYMNRSGGIKGTVRDGVSSLPRPNTMVSAMPSSGGATYYGVGQTDINGNYEINMNLGPGSYNVSVFMPTGYVGQTQSPVTVTAGSWTTGIDFMLQRSGIISGRVTTPGGQPLGNQTVTAYFYEGSTYYFGSDETNATGYYTIASGLGTGNYTVMVGTYPNWDMIENVSVTVGAETSNVDLQLSISPPPASGIIVGKVTESGTGKPVVDAEVTADGQTSASYGQAFTDDEGNYVISQGLETDDTYNVTASASGFQDKSTSVSVQVNQTTSNVNFQLEKIPPAQSGAISGTVTGDTNPIPEFQYPIAIMLVLTLIAVATAKSSKHKAKYE